MIFLGNMTIVYENLAIKQKGSFFCITLWFEDALILNVFIYVIGILFVVNMIHIIIYFYKFVIVFITLFSSYSFLVKPIDRENKK